MTDDERKDEFYFRARQREQARKVAWAASTAVTTTPMTRSVGGGGPSSEKGGEGSGMGVMSRARRVREDPGDGWRAEGAEAG